MVKFIVLGLWLLFSLGTQAKELINVYVYHLKPPFVIDLVEQKGLYFEFSNYLNKIAPEYDFHTIFVPRKRISSMLDQDKLDGILLGVNPIWFNDKQEKNYLWSGKVMIDRDEIVSLKEAPFEYQTPASLKGKILGGVRGFYYQGINELVEKNEIIRVDTVGEDALLHMLMNKRIDTAIISRSAFQYLTQDTELRELFYLSAIPHDEFERRVLFPKSLAVLYKKIAPSINAMYGDPKWQAMIASYH